MTFEDFPWLAKPGKRNSPSKKKKKKKFCHQDTCNLFSSSIESPFTFDNSFSKLCLAC